MWISSHIERICYAPTKESILNMWNAKFLFSFCIKDITPYNFWRLTLHWNPTTSTSKLMFQIMKIRLRTVEQLKSVRCPSVRLADGWCDTRSVGSRIVCNMLQWTDVTFCPTLLNKTLCSACFIYYSIFVDIEFIWLLRRQIFANS